MLHNVLHADETTLQVLHEEGKTPQSKSYIWLYRTSGNALHPIVLYEYQPDRRSQHPKKFLKDFKGYLHTDGYDGYRRISEDIVIVGCLSHVRRKFNDALKILPVQERESSVAFKGKEYCDKLFSFERDFAKLSFNERVVSRKFRKLEKGLC